MPTYEYECDRCGKRVEDVRKMAERAVPQLCEVFGCEGVAHFVISAPAGNFPGANHWRTREKAVR